MQQSLTRITPEYGCLKMVQLVLQLVGQDTDQVQSLLSLSNVVYGCHTLCCHTL